MKYAVVVFLFVVAAAGSTAFGQSTGQSAGTQAAASSSEKPKRQIFRANKDQITEVQTMLKARKLYTGDATGKLDDGTRKAIKSYQKDSGLKETGTLNRATLEKMGIALTDAQKAIPVSANSYASTANGSASPAESSRYIFRANKEQITEAQKMLKSKGLFTGDASGKLDDATRAGLRKYQDTNELKVTGTLNQVTLEKMGIALTDKQKEAASTAKK